MDIQIQVDGMTCGHCERAVTQAIRSIDPQAQVQVDRQQGKVQVHTDAARADLREAMAQAIRDEGYQVA